MAAATVRAQAKINLFLRVTGREASGYHHIETLFCRIALADVVTVRLTPASRSLDCVGPELPVRGLGTVAENLAWRAAVAYADIARWPAGFTIEVEKHIPVSAGLGGGSADAGAVLRALNTLNPRPLAPQTIHDIARSLGADVPFLAQDVSAQAIGLERGDVLRPIAPLPERECVIAMPSVGVSTTDAYRWLDGARDLALSVLESTGAIASWNDVHHLAHNDFEAVVFPRVPAAANAWRFLNNLVGHDGIARMSGSGAAAFAVFTSNPPPQPLPAAPSGVRITLTRTVDRVESVQLID